MEEKIRWVDAYDAARDLEEITGKLMRMLPGDKRVAELAVRVVEIKRYLRNVNVS